MQKILHIVTRTDDSLAAKVIDYQRQETTGVQIDVIDLTQGTPDYQALLEEIFAADSIQVW